MSDPEDVQSDEDQNMSTGEWIYQLRRIGPPATLAKMPDVMRLNLGLTRIGRGQHNDYILDSAVLKNFISRSHVEIYGKKNENGEIEFVLTDKGLNGTFINDIRTHKTCTMEVGDKITFGHTNGYKIQPGSYAEQSQSEFQFQFDRVPRNSKTTEMFSEVLQPTHTPVNEERPDIIPDLKKDTTIVSDRQFLSDLKSNLQSQEKSAKSRTSQKGRSRRDSNSSSDNDIDTSKNSSSVKESKRNSNDSSSKSPVLESGSSRKTLSSGKGVFSETLPAQDEDFSDEIEDEEEEISEDEREKKKKKGPKKGKASIHKKPVVKRKMPDPPSESEESSEEDESSKPEADQRPKSHTQASKLKQPKKKKVGNDAPAVGSRKRRRKGSAAPSSTATTSSELEPGVEWYEDDTCDSPDCKRPKKKKTPWVQCDDCDGWYHTMCVGANYNKLKDSDEHFNCGCE